MYHQTQSNPSYLTQPITTSSSSSHSLTPNRLSPGAQSNSAKQHAFGSDTDNENSDSDDESAGFQVYKDHPSTARYSHLPVTTPPPHSPSSPQTLLNRSPNDPFNKRNTATLLSPTNNKYPPPHHANPTNITPPNYCAPNLTQELVAVPALGSDWEKNESKKDKDWEGKDTFIAKEKWNQRKEKMLTRKSNAYNQFCDFLAGRQNLAGWFNRTMALGLFILCLILVALLSYFLVPRIPTLAYDNQQVFAGDSTNGLIFDQQGSSKFGFNGKINLAMKANSYVKPKISKLSVIIKDLSSTSSAVLVATGSLSNHLAISNKEYTPFSVDLKFAYSANSKTDLVWTSWHEACKHQWLGQADRPTLQLGVIVEFGIMGRLGTFSERTVLNNVACPVELPASAA